MRRLIFILALSTFFACNTSKRTTSGETFQTEVISSTDDTYVQQVSQDSVAIKRMSQEVQELRSTLSSLLEQFSRIENMSTIERDFSMDGILIKEKISTTNVTNESKKQSTEFSTTFYKNEIHRLDSTVNLYMGEVMNLRTTYDSLRVQHDLQTKSAQRSKSSVMNYVVFFLLGTVACLILFLYIRFRR
jgi:hypothetical protein